ncbi:unnamed protein product [Brassica rapa subsp. narinosa]
MQMGDKLWYMESLRGVTLYQVENRYMDQLLCFSIHLRLKDAVFIDSC